MAKKHHTVFWHGKQMAKKKKLIARKYRSVFYGFKVLNTERERGTSNIKYAIEFFYQFVDNGEK